jgi:CBS domain-containing protein
MLVINEKTEGAINNVQSRETGNDVPIVSSNTQLLDALLIMSQKALGMVLITHGKTLQGIFTDGDLCNF